MRIFMAKAKTDFSPLRGINSAADFYGWKKQIVDAMERVDAAYSAELARTNSLLDFFLQKDRILEKLGVSEAKEE